LRESLVRTRLVVGAHELGDEASEAVLAEEEDVEQLPAQGAREPFGERVHVRRAGRDLHDPRPRRHRSGECYFVDDLRWPFRRKFLNRILEHALRAETDRPAGGLVPPARFLRPVTQYALRPVTPAGGGA
jgi:hypothetical protein